MCPDRIVVGLTVLWLGVLWFTGFYLLFRKLTNKEEKPQ